jgi:hypothetical protein
MCVYQCIYASLYVCICVWLYVCVHIYTHNIWSSHNSITSGLARLCWSTGQVITMANPSRNCELKKINYLLNFMLFGLIIWNLLSAKNWKKWPHNLSPPPPRILSFRMTIIWDVKPCSLVKAYNVSEESLNTFLPLYQITRLHIQNSINLVSLIGYNFFCSEWYWWTTLSTHLRVAHSSGRSSVHR